MNYKWRPSKSQARAFAQRMQNDPEYASAYENRKKEREEKRRSTSQFSYNSAGGYYIPTLEQHNFCLSHGLDSDLTEEQKEACSIVAGGFSTGEKVHHDYIHIVNELRRKISFS